MQQTIQRNPRQVRLLGAVVDIMTSGAKTLHPDTLASEAVHFMNENKITNVFVVADRRAVGVLHIHDCLRAGVA